MAKTGGDTTTVDKNITLKVKDFIGLCLFLISIGVSIGGFIKVINDFDKMDKKFDDVNKTLMQIKGDTENMKGQLSQINTYKKE